MTLFRYALAVAIIALIVPAVALPAVEAETYSLVRVALDVPETAAALRANPDLDIVRWKAGDSAEIVMRDAELRWARDAGLAFEIVQPDMAAAYAARGRGENFGAYHTFSEAVEWLDQMHADHPDVVSAKWSLGTSHEGRDLWCVRVSDNPEVDEADEPEILIDGLHHAREVMASETVLMLIDHLGSNYGVDPEITWLLENREIYLVPIVNPDGFVYNETTDPNGGGMWRKNRRDNGDGTYGVDPNRNYPYQWVGSGSSTDPSSLTYRGPSAGSEPEVQAMMALVNAHAFVTSQSFHSYSDLTLYPWGYTSGDSPDDATFIYMADIMTRLNGYDPGQPADLLYTVNGGSFDWVYGAQDEHPKCLAFSNEIGGSTDGFWPDESRRDALFAENLWPCLYLIMAAGGYVQIDDPVVIGGDGNGRLDPGESAGLSFTLENLGVTADATGVTVTLSTDDPYLQLGEVECTLGDLAAMTATDLAAAPIPVVVDAACPDGRTVTVHLQAAWDGGAVVQDLTYPVGSAHIVFEDDFEGPLDQWSVTGDWNLTTDEYHSTSTSLTDSPDAEYGNETETSATLASGIALPGGGTLRFWHRYDIEDDWDHGYVQISVDGGDWTDLAVYTGTQPAWTEVEIDLGEHAGDEVLIRFLLETDYSVIEDGWYVDDVSIEGYGDENGLPPAPALLAPAEGNLVYTVFALSCADVTDPEGDPVTYGFRVYDSADLTSVVFAAQDVTASGGIAECEPSGLTDGATYWWRAFAADDTAWGPMGETRSFVYQETVGVGDALAAFGLRRIGPTGGADVDLALSLPRSGEVNVTVYNARGQAVRTLLREDRTAGDHVLSWDGRDAAGRVAASGVYFVRARADGRSAVSRVLLVR